MVIKEVLLQLEMANHPVARAIHKGNHFKLLTIGFKSGMVLKEHVAHLPSKLIVLSGRVIYREEGREINLSQFEETEIPVNVKHSVEASEDSICILSQGE